MIQTMQPDDIDDQVSIVIEQLFETWRDEQRIAAFGCGPFRRCWYAAFTAGVELGVQLAKPKRKAK